MDYKREDCVLIVNGFAHPDDNTRQRDEPDDIGENAVAYIHSRGRTRSQVFVVGKRRLYWVDNNQIEAFDPRMTGGEFSHKICLNCGLLKPLEDFEKNQRAKGDRIVRRPRCQPCFDIDSGKKMPDRVRKEYRAKHGPSKGDLWQCQICQKYSIADVNARIIVDHDQETGRPRGLLCDSCNTGLGRFKNGEDFLANAIEYLKTTPEEPSPGLF